LIKVENARWLKFVTAHTAVAYFAKKLKGFQRKRVHLKIVLVDKMREKEKCRGMATQISKRSYRIRLDSKLKPLAFVRVIAHEMIHVNQWLTGKMEDINGNRCQVRWGKKLYNMPMKYSNHPWEKEAYRMDYKLAQSFIDFYTSGWRK
jgi:hypothetical protein